MQQQVKDEYAGRRCTLDGHPAKITGRLLPFAIVGTHFGGLAAEYSWEAVVRIMAKGGDFKL